MRMVDVVRATAGRYPDHVAYEFMGKKTTYAELIRQIGKTSDALRQIGVQKGDIVCIAMPNVPQAIMMIYAVNQLGGTVNMIHPLSSENELLTFVNRVEAKTILVLDQFYDKIKAIREQTGLQHIIVASVGDALAPLKRIGYALTAGRKLPQPKGEESVALWKDFYRSGQTYTPQTEDSDEDIALILHSGGTTGKVKGVCLSNRNVNTSAQQMIEGNPMIQSTDRFLSVMPIFHGNGLVIGVHAMLMIGARCVLIPRFTPESYAKDLLKSRCNYMSGVPALFERLMEVEVMQNADLSFLKGVFSGADYLSVELEGRINQFLQQHHAPVRVRQGYGMTEGVVATTLNPMDRQKPGSVGLPLPGVAVKIVKPNTEEEVPAGEIGEIVFSSETNMVCYFRDEEETALVKRCHADGKTWIHSGDLGTVDDEGFVYFKGRIKRMIVTNGYNVFPNELENIIEGFPMVDRCCVLGVPHSEGSQKIKAFILLKKGTAPSDETREEILALCRKNIAKYALPKAIQFVEEIPKTKVGKVDYQALLKDE